MGQLEAMNVTIDQWNNFCRIMIWKCIQHIMKENLLLLKDFNVNLYWNLKNKIHKHMTSVSKHLY